MNSKKKTVAVAMATALGVSGMMSPVAVYAQEKLVNGQKRIEESQIKQNASQQPITIDNGGTPISGDININETNFPDKEFRDWIKTHIIGADNDVLTPDEISNITRIDVSNESEIKNLKGIEHFTALKGLYCHNTGITTLDVSKNVLLTELFCGGTGIITLDVSNNKKLIYLNSESSGRRPEARAGPSPRRWRPPISPAAPRPCRPGGRTGSPPARPGRWGCGPDQ